MREKGGGGKKMMEEAAEKVRGELERHFGVWCGLVEFVNPRGLIVKTTSGILFFF